MKKILLLTILFVFASACFSQNTILNYAAGSIADSLKENANTVLRLDEATLEVLSPSKYDLKVHEVATVLNAEGDFHLHQRFYYDKFSSVSDVAITVYNTLGLPVKKYSKKDFTTRAAFDGFSLATDDKLMELDLIAPEYPYTIDIQYEQKVNSYIELPDWVLNTRNTSTEVFRYTVTVPSELGIRYRFFNFKQLPTVDSANNKKVYTWQVRNAKAKKIQQGGFKTGSYDARVEIAPNVFEYDDHPGNFSSWNNFGKWSFPLYQETNPFTENRKNEIKALVANYKTPEEKIRVLYDYLKSNVRYVSIQFGIGGFKPFAVSYVDEKKYGDCKALTNYMRYLLATVDIKSYPALINAGNGQPPIDPDFPVNAFNHVILCVPNQPDTIWLECTSQDNEMGFLGTFTENKNALVLTENGGVLTKTPSSKAENNILSTRTDIFLDDEGGAKSYSRLYSTGEIADLFHHIKKQDEDEQKQIFVDYLHYKPGDDFEMKFLNDSLHGAVYQLSLSFGKLYSFKAGNKYFLPQRINQVVYDELKNEPREVEYLFDYPYQKIDSTVFHLPKSFTSEELPSESEINNQFVYYKKQIIPDLQNGRLTLVTELYLKKHIIPANQYKIVFDSFSKVKENEEQNLVLKKL